MFFLYKSVASCTLIRCAPSFPFGLFSHHSVRGNSLQCYPSFAGETIGTRIDRGNPLIMSLRLRGGCATECHAFSYFSSSSALIFSPPCGSCSVFEVAHTVYKYALNKCSFIRNCNKVASLYTFNVFYSARSQHVLQSGQQVGTNLNVLRKLHKF